MSNNYTPKTKKMKKNRSNGYPSSLVALLVLLVVVLLSPSATNNNSIVVAAADADDESNFCGSPTSICRIDRLLTDNIAGVDDEVMHVCNIVYEMTQNTGEMSISHKYMMLHISHKLKIKYFDCITSTKGCYVEYNKEWLTRGTDSYKNMCHMKVPDNQEMLNIVELPSNRNLMGGQNNNDNDASSYTAGATANNHNKNTIIHTKNTNSNVRSRSNEDNTLNTTSSISDSNSHSNSSSSRRRHLAQKTTGDLTMLIVRVNSGILTTTENDALNYVFRNTDSVTTHLNACSQGQAQFVKRPGEHIIELNTDNAITTYDIFPLFNELRPKLLSRYNLPDNSPLTDVADHILYVLPDGIKGSATGWGALPGPFVGIPEKFLSWIQNISHELGHNLGLNHGWENGVEYEDRTTVMGLSKEGLVNICYNGYQMKALNWYWERSMQIDDITAQGTLVKVAFVGDYAYSKPDEVAWVVVNDDIYLSFNRKVGINEQTGEYGDTLLLNRKFLETSAQTVPDTILLAHLDNIEPNNNIFNAQNYVIEVCSINFKDNTSNNKVDYITVTIARQAGTCDTAIPATSSNPVDLSNVDDIPDPPPPTGTPDNPNPITPKPVQQPTNTPPPVQQPTDNSGNINLHVDIVYDNYPEETRWKLTKKGTNQLVHQENDNKKSGLSKTVLSIPQGQYMFEMNDTGNDGICCKGGEGNIRIYQYINGEYEMYLLYSTGIFRSNYKQEIQTWEESWFSSWNN